MIPPAIAISNILTSPYLQHYQRDADGLCCRLKYPVENTSGSIEYRVSMQDFKESKFCGLVNYTGNTIRYCANASAIAFKVLLSIALA